ncbi:unnamed protein product [Arabis nemorensis]|uniref:MATH domain-containing protein n=1 Tax=Arabis nemorensis TaxID=586526 RepID=A0A565BXK4_9BRAS|nr:unnamed protein product [Arabis nemorensis]
MENEEADKKFTWVIKNFSSLPSEKIFSDIFVVGGCKWRFKAFPKGNNNAENLSLYLDVAESESLPSGWERTANYKTEHCLDEKEPDWGFTSMFPLNELAKDSGFLANGELKIVAEIKVLKVIGQLDVYGFQVLPSQLKSLSRLFERHPDVATKVSIKNQYLKTGYMNVLLSLIETLRQSPKKISKDDLDDAYAAVESMTDVGFELEWLKKKLDQVSEKKEKEEVGEIQIQKIEEELKDLKQKCSDLEVRLEKEKAEVLAAKAPVLLADDF